MLSKGGERGNDHLWGCSSAQGTGLEGLHVCSTPSALFPSVVLFIRLPGHSRWLILDREEQKEVMAPLTICRGYGEKTETCSIVPSRWQTWLLVLPRLWVVKLLVRVPLLRSGNRHFLSPLTKFLSLLTLFFIFIFSFYWSIVDLQCCISSGVQQSDCYIYIRFHFFILFLFF